MTNLHATGSALHSINHRSPFDHATRTLFWPAWHMVFFLYLAMSKPPLYKAIHALSHIRLCKKESQLQSKKTDFSQEKSRKSQKKVKKIDFSLTFLD